MIGEYFRRGVAILILLAAVTAVYVQYERTRPCALPISYHVGAIDPRFNISEEAFVKDMQKATGLWNAAAGKTLFKYDLKGNLPVDLIYDSRQQNATTGLALKDAEEAYEARKVEVEKERAVYDQAPTTALYKKLNADIAALNVEARALNAKIKDFNANAGSFEQGLYHQDATHTEIDVYEFTSETQLVRLLAHEFGHALGLDHNEDSDSIMYPVNRGSSLALSSADLSALKKLCNLK